MPLTDKQAQDVCCQYGQAHQCRYLTLGGKTGPQCTKKNSRLKSKIDKEVNLFISKENKAGRDPWSGYKSLYDGGSCQGFIMLSQKMQGK